MRKYKYLLKKAAAFATAGILAVSYLQPFYAFAEETDSSEKTVEQTEEPTASPVSSEISAETQTDENKPVSSAEPEADVTTEPEETASPTPSEEPEAVSTAQPSESPAATASPAPVKKAQAKAKATATAKPSESEKKESPAASSTQEPAPAANTVLSSSVADDVTKPVIESFELDQNGKTLKNGDTLTLKVKAYDADSGIKQINAEFYTEDYRTAFSLDLKKTDEENVYAASYTLNDVSEGKYTLRKLRVTDYNSNYADAEIYDQSYNYIYYFNVEEDDNLAVSSFSFKGNNGQFDQEDLQKVDDQFGFSVKTAKTFGDDARVALEFTSQNGYTLKFYSIYDPDNDGVYNSFHLGAYSNIQDDGNYEYTLKHVYITRGVGESELSLDQKDTYKFKINMKKTEHVDLDVQVKDVEISHATEFVGTGDEVKITIRTGDMSKYQNVQATATFYASSSIENPSQYVSLTYDSSKNEFTGTWKIDESIYSCEWYLNSLSVYSNEGSGYVYFEPENDYYVNVKTGSTFVDQAMDTTVRFWAQSSKGEWSVIGTKNFKNIGRRVSLKELGVSFPSDVSCPEGVKHTGWRNSIGNEITEDSTLLNAHGMLEIYATYDKLAFDMYFNYVDVSGNLKNVQNLIKLDLNATKSDLISSINSYIPSDMTKEYTFANWDTDNNFMLNSLNEPLSNHPVFAAIGVYAKYQGKTLLSYSQSYIQEDGFYTNETASYSAKPLLVDDGSTFDDVVASLNKEALPKMLSGMKFKEWIYTGSSYGQENYVFKNGDSLYQQAVYENHLVRFLVEDESKAEDMSLSEKDRLIYFSYKLVEKGDKVTIPDQIDGISNLQWQYIYPATEDDMTFIVGEDNYFDVYSIYGTGSTSSSSSVGNSDSGTSSGQGGNTSPSVGTPAVRPSENVISDTVTRIMNAEEGSTVTVSMGNATVVTKEILEAAKGKNVNVVLDMGGYKWTINGMSILDSNLKDVDLAVAFDTNAIPSKVIKELAGNNPVRQLSLAYSGNFGFKATLTMNIGNEYAGKIGNLYYYDSEGRMIFMDAGKIGTDGSISLDFSHASDYAIVISDHVMGTGSSSSKDVQSGVTDTAAPYAALILACVAGAYVLKNRYSA